MDSGRDGVKRGWGGLMAGGDRARDDRWGAGQVATTADLEAMEVEIGAEMEDKTVGEVGWGGWE